MYFQSFTMMLTGRIWTSSGRMMVCCIDINMGEKKKSQQVHFPTASCHHYLEKWNLAISCSIQMQASGL